MQEGLILCIILGKTVHHFYIQAADALCKFGALLVQDSRASEDDNSQNHLATATPDFA